MPQLGGLPACSVRVPEERVDRGQILDRADVKEPRRVAAAAPLAGEDPVDGHAGGENRRPDLPCLIPAVHAEIALGGAVVQRETGGITGSGSVGVAHDGDDSGFGEACEARVGRGRRGWEKEGRHGGEDEKKAHHRLSGTPNASSNRPHRAGFVFVAIAIHRTEPRERTGGTAGSCVPSPSRSPG